MCSLSFILRCLLEEEADDCREKDPEIKNLNKMVLELSGLVRQLEKGKVESMLRKKSQVSYYSNISFPLHFELASTF